MNHMNGESSASRSNKSSAWIDKKIESHKNACEQDKELKYNINFLTSLKLFSRQITDWITKIAKIDYDEIAKLVGELDETNANEVVSPSMPGSQRRLLKGQSLMSN